LAVNVLEGQIYGKRIEASEERGRTGVALKKQAGTQLGRRSAAAIAEAAHQALGAAGKLPAPQLRRRAIPALPLPVSSSRESSARLGRGRFRRVLPVACAGLNWPDSAAGKTVRPDFFVHWVVVVAHGFSVSTFRTLARRLYQQFGRAFAATVTWYATFVEPESWAILQRPLALKIRHRYHQF
jgi:hypothetical protein